MACTCTQENVMPAVWKVYSLLISSGGAQSAHRCWKHGKKPPCMSQNHMYMYVCVCCIKKYRVIRSCSLPFAALYRQKLRFYELRLVSHRADAVEEACRHERVRTDACGCRRQERAHDRNSQSTAQHPLGAEFHRQHTTDDLRQHVAPEKRAVDGAAQVAIPVKLTSL